PRSPIFGPVHLKAPSCVGRAWPAAQPSHQRRDAKDDQRRRDHGDRLSKGTLDRALSWRCTSGKSCTYLRAWSVEQRKPTIRCHRDPARDGTYVVAQRLATGEVSSRRQSEEQPEDAQAGKREDPWMVYINRLMREK